MKKLLIIIGVTVGLNTSIVAGPIHDAAKNGDIDEIKSLISIGVSVDHKSDSGATALYFTVGWNQFEAADYLISIGANVNAVTNNGTTPIFAALSLDKMKFLNLLISNGANVNHQYNQGKTPIFNSSNTQIMNVLIASGADINHQDKQGRTVLMYQRLSSLMRLQLIENGAKLDLKDIRGKTALHYAARYESPEVVQSLLTHKADINAKDTYRKTPLDYIYDADFQDSEAAKFNILQQAGAKAGLQLLEQKVDQLSAGTTNPTDEWPRKMWEIDLGEPFSGAGDLVGVGDLVRGGHNAIFLEVSSRNLSNRYWIQSDGSYVKIDDTIGDSNVLYFDANNFIYAKIEWLEGDQNKATVTKLSKQQTEVSTQTFNVKNLSQLDSGSDISAQFETVQVSWEGTKITAWDFTPPSSTVPKPDDGNGGGNGGGNETVNSRLIIKTAGPDIALATDGKLGAAELQKSNDLRSWRRLGDVPAEASEVLLTPRESGNEFYRLKKN